MEKSKLILGLKGSNEFSLEERRMIIEEWLESGKTKREIWQKYTGESSEKGGMIRWMRQLGLDVPKRWSKKGVSKTGIMSKSQKDTSLELLVLQAKIKELEKSLINSELRATALDTMIEIAEKELKINIRKKSNTKQSIR